VSSADEQDGRLRPDLAGRGRVHITQVGLMIPTDLSFDDWEAAGRHLSGIVDSSCWWLGDWLVFGKRNYADRYPQAIRTAGLQYQTLRNYAWVARRFDLGRRRARLSFQHHAEVASLPPDEQTHWLDLAEGNLWTTKQLRAGIKAAQSDQSAEPGSVVMPRITVVESQINQWRSAAERLGTPFDNWVMHALDTAAEQVLGERSVTDGVVALTSR
jgi:hypothetical protein